MRKRLMILTVLTVAAFVVGCGNSDGGSATTSAAPTKVTAADLDRDGEFWLTLTPDLRDELIDLGKERLGADRPDGATGIRAVPAAELVAEMEKQYANEAKRSISIYATYTGANDTLARAGLDDALNQMELLCDGDPKPEQCADDAP